MAFLHPPSPVCLIHCQCLAGQMHSHRTSLRWESTGIQCQRHCLSGAGPGHLSAGLRDYAQWRDASEGPKTCLLLQGLHAIDYYTNIEKFFRLGYTNHEMLTWHSELCRACSLKLKVSRCDQGFPSIICASHSH